MIELKQITAFLAVAQQSSFSKAAASMFFSQSALSKQIALLEADLGVKLFLRDKHSVYLTDAGSSFLPVALDLQERAEHAVNMLSNIESDIKTVRTISIGYEAGLVEEPFSRQVIMRSAAVHMREHPHVRVKMHRMEANGQAQGIISGDIDIAIYSSDQPLEESAHDSQITGVTLMSSDLVIVLPRSMCSEDDVVPPGGSMKIYTMENDFRAVAQCLAVLPNYGIRPSFYYCNDLMNVMLAAESGQGAVVMPLIMKSNLDLENVRIFPVDRTLAALYVNAIWKRGNNDPYTAALFSSIMEAYREYEAGLQ